MLIKIHPIGRALGLTKERPVDSKTRRERLLIGMESLKLTFEFDTTPTGNKARKLIDAIIADPDNKQALNELNKFVKA